MHPVVVDFENKASRKTSVLRNVVAIKPHDGSGERCKGWRSGGGVLVLVENKTQISRDKSEITEKLGICGRKTACADHDDIY